MRYHIYPVLLLLCVISCSESPFDAYTDLGAGFLPYIDTSFAPFEQPLPVLGASALEDTLLAVHRGRNYLTIGSWRDERAFASMVFSGDSIGHRLNSHEERRDSLTSLEFLTRNVADLSTLSSNESDLVLALCDEKSPYVVVDTMSLRTIGTTKLTAAQDISCIQLDVTVNRDTSHVDTTIAVIDTVIQDTAALADTTVPTDTVKLDTTLVFHDTTFQINLSLDSLRLSVTTVFQTTTALRTTVVVKPRSQKTVTPPILDAFGDYDTSFVTTTSLHVCAFLPQYHQTTILSFSDPFLRFTYADTAGNILCDTIRAAGSDLSVFHHQDRENEALYVSGATGRFARLRIDLSSFWDDMNGNDGSTGHYYIPDATLGISIPIDSTHRYWEDSLSIYYAIDTEIRESIADMASVEHRYAERVAINDSRPEIHVDLVMDQFLMDLFIENDIPPAECYAYLYLQNSNNHTWGPSGDEVTSGVVNLMQFRLPVPDSLTLRGLFANRRESTAP